MVIGNWLKTFRARISLSSRMRRKSSRRLARRRQGQPLLAGQVTPLESRILPAAPVVLKDVWEGPDSSDVIPWAEVDGKLLFTANDGIHGTELWVTDGSSGGTVLLKDINVGDEYTGSYAYGFVKAGGTVFFTAHTEEHSVELWKTDGTPEGTVMVKDITPGDNDSTPSDLTVVNGIVYFAASDENEDRELWRSDGTPEGTYRVKDILPGAGFENSSVPTNLKNVNGTLFFTAKGPEGRELWKSDGTEGGTVLVKDIWPGATESYISGMTVVGSNLFFTASDGYSWTPDGHGSELWMSDGTEEGTQIVKDIAPGPNGSYPEGGVAMNGILYFIANDPAGGHDLWRSDGSSEGTYRILDVTAPEGPPEVYGLMPIGGTLYFAVGTDFSMDDIPHGVTDLWKSDGTADGTEFVTTVSPAVAGNYLGNMTNVQGALYFTTYNEEGASELWKSDGTAAGTTVIDLGPGAASSPDPYYLTVFEDALYFVATTATLGEELWKLELEVVGNDSPSVSIDPTTISLDEGTNIPAGFVVANIQIEDDGVGTNILSLSGVDAEYFELDGNTLVLKAGTVLDFETKQTYSVTVNVDDPSIGGAVDTSATFTLNVTNVNELPTVSLTEVVSTLAEDASTAAAIEVATIQIADDDLGTNVLSLAGADAAFFEIVDNSLRLKAGTVLNFEGKSSYAVTVNLNDASLGGAVDSSAVFTLSVTDVNEPPSISLTDVVSSLPENTSTASGITIATIQVSDDALGSYVLSLGNEDTPFFEIVGNSLRLKPGVVLNFESKAFYNIAVAVDDEELGSNIEDAVSLDLALTDVNEAPTAISFAELTNSLSEHASTATAIVVGSAIMVIDDALGSETLSLSGPDAAFFQIVNGDLRLKAGTVLDFETKPTYSVTINVNDPTVGGNPDASFDYTLTLNDEDDTQVISLSNNTLAEAQKKGTVVGTLSLSAPAAKPKYTLVAGAGSTDNSKFSISGNQLKTRAILNFEAQDTYTIRVQMKDGKKPPVFAVFVITVTNVNEPPTVLNLSNLKVAENNSPGHVVGTFSSNDPDQGDTWTYTLVPGKGDADNASFTIVDNELRANGAFDYEQRKKKYSIRVRVTDGAGRSFERKFTILVTNVRDPR